MEKYLELLKGKGAKGRIIETATIVTAPWTIHKCKYGCDFYGKRYSCPPYTATWRETQEIIDCYKTAILFTIDEHSHTDITQIAIELSAEIFKDGYYKAIAYGSGPCLKCKDCGLTVCRFPKATLPSMEGSGIDVFQTARNNGYEIKPLRNMDEPHHYFGLILVE